MPRPYGDYGSIVKWRIAESFPDSVGAFIDWLVKESGWTVEEEGRAAPIRPRHIAILFRRFRNFGEDVTRSYVRALEARRIPHVLVGGRSFHDCEEVIALRNAITAIEWPDDELRVFATLRGPFGATRLSLHFGRMSTATAPQRPAVSIRRRWLSGPHSTLRSPNVADALQLLRRLHVGRNHRPIAETITMLLEALRACRHRALANRRAYLPFAPCPSRQRHNAGYQTPENRIFYPFHPRCGEPVAIVRTHRFQGADVFVVQQPDGTLAHIPRWMMEETAARYSLGSQPRLPLDHLRNLRLGLAHVPAGRLAHPT